jgi:queuine tRNA-ribosyltransferase
MPVGTVGTVKAMYAHEVEALGADVVLANTYHLMLHPGAERVARLGGLHEMMQWRRPILTDSGGFQVMSLSKLRKLDERGVTFQSHIDGARYELTPERSMEIQGLLGSDIQMQLDECVRLPTSRDDIERAMRLSLRWAERSRAAFSGGPGQGVFGIVQGGDDKALRIESARALADMDFHGLAIGGLAVGEPQTVMLAMIETVEPYLPQEKPRYLMGVGTPDDLLQSLSRGVDMFDCVMPTRAGRHGLAYTRHGRMNLKNARFQDDARPIDETSAAFAGRQFSRAYLRHLVKSGEILGMMALTAINIAYYQQLMESARQAIAAGRLRDFVAETRENWARGEQDGAPKGAQE